jgi:hypothetical protein
VFIYFIGPPLCSGVAVVRSLDLRGASVVANLRSLDLSSAPVSPSANLPSGFVVVGLSFSVIFVRSLDLPVFSSSSSGRYTSLWLRHRCQVANLPPALSSSSSGRSTSLRLRRHLRQVARPPSSSIVVDFRSLDLLRLCLHLHLFGRPLQDFASGVKANLWGARLMALPSTSGYLGAFCFRTFPRSACLEWLCQTLCSYAGYLGVSTLQTFKINKFLVSSATNPGHRNFSYDIITDFFI